MDVNNDFIKTYAAAFAAVFGGIGIKIIERLVSKNNTQFSDAATIREELRAEITTLREDVERYSTEADEWRIKYYEKAEDILKLTGDIVVLRTEIDGLKQHYHSDIENTSIDQ